MCIDSDEVAQETNVLGTNANTTYSAQFDFNFQHPFDPIKDTSTKEYDEGVVRTLLLISQ
jgi:hypothetical protein